MGVRVPPAAGYAIVAELVDALVSRTSVFGHGGSSPSGRKKGGADEGSIFGH
jgi:hypothetical protein